MKDINNNEYWAYFTSFIASEFDSGVFDLIIKPNRFNSYENGVYTLVSPSKTVQSLINDQFKNRLEAFILADSGNKVKINAILENKKQFQSQFVLEEVVPQQNHYIGNVIQTPKNNYILDSMVLNFLEEMKPDKNMTFDQFVIGESNKIAYAGAKSFCEPNSKYNILFFYGDSGVGKSHIINSIGNQFKNDGKKVVYMSAIKFVEIYMASLGHISPDKSIVNSVDEFTKIISQLDILIIDDVQGFVDKTGSTDTFFNVFETLYSRGKRVVIASDVPPKTLKGIPNRLKTRFAKGLQFQIFKPNFELSKNYLKREFETIWVDRPELVITDEVYELLVLNYGSDFRTLKGVVDKLDFTITMNYTNVISSEYISKYILGSKIQKTKIKGVEIQKVVSNKYMVEASSLVGKSRKKDVKEARHVAIYLYRKKLDHSYKEIGSVFGGRDHSTIIHSEKTVKNKMKLDKPYKEFVLEIEKEIFT